MSVKKKSLVGWANEDWILYWHKPFKGVPAFVSHSTINKVKATYYNTKVRITIEEVK